MKQSMTLYHLYKMEAVFLLGIYAALVAFASASTKCCPDTTECFELKGIWSHMPAPKCIEDINPKFGLFSRANKGTPQFLTRTSAIPSAFRRTKRTIFIIHGYTNNFDSDWMHEMKDALLEKEDANVVVVGWGDGAGSIWYPDSASSVRTLGYEVAKMMDRLKNEGGLPYNKLWCVGHSLGSHACGQTGMRTKIGRITGLDPAGPWFDGKHEDTRLDPRDADLVDVIHSDGWGVVAFYGMLTPCGHLDFYPNGGFNQPGCWTSLPDGNTISPDLAYRSDWELYLGEVSCSHSRAPKFFLESIKNAGCFHSDTQCTDHGDIPKKNCGSCGRSTCAMMGYEADKYHYKDGLYYMETTSKSPYCMY